MSELSHLVNWKRKQSSFQRVAAECEKTGYAVFIGKDSSVMLHLAMKAFYRRSRRSHSLHVNTTRKCKEMIDFRDRRQKISESMLEYINRRC